MAGKKAIFQTNIVNFLPHFNSLNATDKTLILLNIESSNFIAQEVLGNFIKELYQERWKLTSWATSRTPWEENEFFNDLLVCVLQVLYMYIGYNIICLCQ